jgi:hypothetical protein
VLDFLRKRDVLMVTRIAFGPSGQRALRSRPPSSPSTPEPPLVGASSKCLGVFAEASPRRRRLASTRATQLR